VAAESAVKSKERWYRRRVDILKCLYIRGRP
jgi:hypothetical protein